MLRVQPLGEALGSLSMWFLGSQPSLHNLLLLHCFSSEGERDVKVLGFKKTHWISEEGGSLLFLFSFRFFSFLFIILF